VLLLVQRCDGKVVRVLPVRVDDARIQFEPAEPLDDFGGSQAGLDVHTYQRVFSTERVGQQGHGARGGRDHAHAQLAGQAGLHCRDLLLERVAIGKDTACPQHESLTFGGETLKALPAPNQRNRQLVLELADGFGQRRMGDVAGVGGAGEVPLSSERHEVLELTEQHDSFDHVPGR
jgi:hypothetical protein